ncbi:CDC16 protein [Coemansia sp. RSA 2704]|nr:CDC16 protein [Coemansia sp. RSA 2705]KAJ2321384.1 CDC16 protein [Coemansia sp. RSA 2704]
MFTRKHAQNTQPPTQEGKRGMTPRMLELSRRLSDIEFQEYVPAPVLSPSAFSRFPTRRRGTMPAAIREEEDEGGALQRLRDRMRVPASEPARLGGLELVEPAKVDGQYREDVETSEYRRRRRMRESIGSSEGFGGGAAARAQLAHDERASAAERRRLVALTRRMHEDWDEVGASLREVRVLVAGSGGLPVGGAQAARLRTTLWLAMLEVRAIGLDGYARALRCCPSASAAKIDNDAFRTLAGDVEFRHAVSTEAIVRVLNAVLSAPDRTPSDPPRYVQGMNTLLAPFLYVMGESAGFYAFRQFLRKECPLYARPSLPGVHACVHLVDECLAHVDARLFSHLKRHGAVARIYAFPAAMTLSASVGPLRQVVRLWDFLLAFGVHLNVVCIVAQLLSMRELLLTTRSPMAFLRSWPPLRADSVIRRTRDIYELLPDRLRRRIKLHAHDPQLAERLASAPQVADPISEPAAWAQQQRKQQQQPQSARRVPSPLSLADTSHLALHSLDNTSHLPLHALPPARHQHQPSLKRDLPLSPDVTAPSICSSPTSRNSSMASRPRARTFSGMAKRLRTATSIRAKPEAGARMEITPVEPPPPPPPMRPQPSYGSMGLGIRSNASTEQPRVLSNGRRQQQQQQQHQQQQHYQHQRGMRLVAGSEALWMLDRKLSAEHKQCSRNLS